MVAGKYVRQNHLWFEGWNFRFCPYVEVHPREKLIFFVVYHYFKLAERQKFDKNWARKVGEIFDNNFRFLMQTLFFPRVHIISLVESVHVTAKPLQSRAVNFKASTCKIGCK